MEQKRNFEKNILPEIESKLGQHYEKLKRIYNPDLVVFGLNLAIFLDTMVSKSF